MDSTTAILVALLGSSVVATIIAGIFNRRRNVADSTKIQVEATIALIEPLKRRVEELERDNKELMEQIDRVSQNFASKQRGYDVEMAALRQQNERLAERVKRLEAQIISIGHKPVEQE